MANSLKNPVLLTCKQDGGALVLVTAEDGKVLTVCPTCGSGADSKDVRDYSSGLKSGILSKEQLVNLRKQISIAKKN